MVYNNNKGIVKCCAVNIPFMFGQEKEHLKDICAMTGATLVDNEHLLHLEDVKFEHFGTASKI